VEGAQLTWCSDYIQIRAPVYLPHTAGRYASKRFRKAQCPIVERLTNSLMMNGRNNGKKLMAVRIVKHAFDIIYLLTDQNPIQVTVDAIVNCGPREDSTRIGSAGTVRRQAVDVSPLRRVNQAIALLTIGAREAAFRNVKTIAECLAEELINAAKYCTPFLFGRRTNFVEDRRLRTLLRRRTNSSVLHARIVRHCIFQLSFTSYFCSCRRKIDSSFENQKSPRIAALTQPLLIYWTYQVATN
jgi:small subunit ribosomal protein S5e